MEADADRRRPGRREHVSRSLIPLLRSSGTLSFGRTMTVPERDTSLDPARGIIVGVLLSLVIWLPILLLLL